ncbi:methyltransferase [Streptomyces griseofuscus]|uniref:Methyltransferase n=1 Tax=Streptomyces griseofuscus TaxID=146922 RepID=A0A3R8RGE2_9ACTN|nr:methyltransferase domain-containing protein [Streptomyces griseofuscus]RRQ80520.1 methyltransferase [Streptomyces griseofuscus]RRQ87097.1 methyltransferase [Streptomyces griseofuscus]
MADVCSTEGPEAYDIHSAPIMAPFVAALLDAVRPAPGESVLDLACGTGFAARAAAALVGPTGRVRGTDLDEGMIRVARQRAPRIDFIAAPADRLPYDDSAFDAVVCQQGAQFFPDLTAALTETARITRPGGRFAATVWAPLDRQPYFLAHEHALRTYAPDALRYFHRAYVRTADQLTSALRTAGYGALTHREVTSDVVLPPLGAYAHGHLAALWGGLLREAGGEKAVLGAARLVRDELADRTAPDGTAALPFTVHLVTGIR